MKAVAKTKRLMIGLACDVAARRSGNWTHIRNGRCGQRVRLRSLIPNVPGNLGTGGALFMLKVKGTSIANLGASYAAGATFDVEWAPVAMPYSFSPKMPGNSVWAQGRAQSAATFARLEGCWCGNDVCDDRLNAHGATSRGGRRDERHRDQGRSAGGNRHRARSKEILDDARGAKRNSMAGIS